MRRRIDEKEFTSHIVEAVAKRVPDAVGEVINDSIAVDPVIVEARANREFGGRCPINRRIEAPRLNIHAEITERDAGYL